MIRMKLSLKKDDMELISLHKDKNKDAEVSTCIKPNLTETSESKEMDIKPMSKNKKNESKNTTRQEVKDSTTAIPSFPPTEKNSSENTSFVDSVKQQKGEEKLKRAEAHFMKNTTVNNKEKEKKVITNNDVSIESAKNKSLLINTSFIGLCNNSSNEKILF